MILEIFLAGLVQGGLIVSVTYVASRCISERSAATRYALWFAALLAVVFIPILTIAFHTGARLVEAFQAPTIGHGVAVSLLPAGTLTRDVAEFTAPVTVWLIAAWVAGATFQFGRLFASFKRIQQIRQKAIPVQALGHNVLVSPELSVPIAVGFRVPAVILPEGIVKTNNPADLERIIAHEVAHIRRMDVAANVLQRIVEAVLFFNPWIFVIGHELSKEREAAADDWAVAQTGAADDYAECLASLAQTLCRRQARLMVPSAVGSHHSVVARIERVIRNGAAGILALNYYAIGGLVMIFAVMTIAFQALTPVSAAPAIARSAFGNTGKGVVLALGCAVRNGNPSTVSAVTPDIPRGAGVSGGVDVLVNIAANGKLTKATIMRSSGNKRVDEAVLAAAKASTYAPAHKDCRPVAGMSVFRAILNPAP